jgi:hypothetical protein
MTNEKIGGSIKTIGKDVELKNKERKINFRQEYHNGNFSPKQWQDNETSAWETTNPLYNDLF